MPRTRRASCISCFPKIFLCTGPLSPEQRVPADHPLRAVRALTDEALQTMSRRFASLYATTGRPSIPPEQLLRALLLQVLYTVRSERLLMEELNYNLLFRWFVGLNMDDPVWHPTTFTKNRDRLLSGDVAAAFFDAVQAHARAAGLLSDEHFTVDGTQLEAWASLKSFRCVDADVASSTGPRPSRPAPAYRAPRTGHSCAPVQWRGPQPARAVASWAAEVEPAPQGRRGPFADRRCCSRRGRGWL